MLVAHRGRRPRVDPSAWVAPTAVVCGDVTIGPGTCVSFGAVVTAEGGSITIGRECVVMEGAVVRASRRHPTVIGDHVLIGPRAHVTGCTVETCAFLATGASVFNGARVGARAELRINAVLHVNSRLEEGATVPIGWVAVGDPAKALAPSEHEAIWAIQEGLDFPGTVFGLRRPGPGESIMPEVTRRYCRALRAHAGDVAGEERPGRGAAP